MAQDIRVFTVVVPVGGTATAPQIFPLTMPSRSVRNVEIVIPDGVRGLVGIALGVGGTAVIPSNPGAYVFGNDEVIHWGLEGFPDTGAWQLLAYNVGTFQHAIQLRFLLSLVTQQQAQVFTAIDTALING